MIAVYVHPSSCVCPVFTASVPPSCPPCLSCMQLPVPHPVTDSIGGSGPSVRDCRGSKATKAPAIQSGSTKHRKLTVPYCAKDASISTHWDCRFYCLVDQPSVWLLRTCFRAREIASYATVWQYHSRVRQLFLQSHISSPSWRFRNFWKNGRTCFSLATSGDIPCFSTSCRRERGRRQEGQVCFHERAARDHLRYW